MEINKYAVKKDELPLIKKGVGSRVLQVFLNTDMRLSFLGLTEIARKNKINVSALSRGQYLLFINRSKTMLKMFAANGVLACYQSPSGKLEMQMISEIPKAFQSHEAIPFDSALEKALLTILKKRQKQRVDLATINRGKK